MAVLGGVEAEGDVYPTGTFAGGVVEDELVEGEVARLEDVDDALAVRLAKRVEERVHEKVQIGRKERVLNLTNLHESFMTRNS